jgi:DNA processing protein
MDENMKAMLLLNSVDSAGMRTCQKIRSKGLPLRALWEDSGDAFRDAGLADHVLSELRKRADAKWAENEYDKCSELGVNIVTYEDDSYPAALKELRFPPLLLYWYGDMKILPEKTAGVVGTRRASPYGRRIAQGIGERCAVHDIALVSGGASGIDGSAHYGACSRGGATFAVFGTGVDVSFPSSNKGLFEQIRENGALISEFPLGTRGEAWRFPKRNRIVAALSEKLIVVEAPLKSGAMITARMALELGREIWAVPGHIDEDAAEGTNRLIFEGAFPFVDNETFFKTLPFQMSLFDDKENALQKDHDKEEISNKEAAVLSLLRHSGERTVDNIALEVKMSAADILKIIAVLSAKGMVCLSGPGRYSARV